jgi:hypothetical protein
MQTAHATTAFVASAAFEDGRAKVQQRKRGKSKMRSQSKGIIDRQHAAKLDSGGNALIGCWDCCGKTGRQKGEEIEAMRTPGHSGSRWIVPY